MVGCPALFPRCHLTSLQHVTSSHIHSHVHTSAQYNPERTLMGHGAVTASSAVHSLMGHGAVTVSSSAVHSLMGHGAVAVTAVLCPVSSSTFGLLRNVFITCPCRRVETGFFECVTSAAKLCDVWSSQFLKIPKADQPVLWYQVPRWPERTCRCSTGEQHKVNQGVQGAHIKWGRVQQLPPVCLWLFFL
jgi:hypothetical protein